MKSNAHWGPLALIALLLAAVPLSVPAQSGSPSAETLERLAKEAHVGSPGTELEFAL